MSEPEQLKPTAVDDAPDFDHVAGHAPGSAGPTTLGSQLAAKREQLGWAVAEVASHLKLAPRQIEAMEADNYAALPTMVMTRGFIRSYAKLLDLDVSDALAAISPAAAAQPVRASAHGQLSTPFSESRFSLMGRSKFAYKWLVVLAVLLLLLAVAIRLDVLPIVQNTLQSLTEKSAASAPAAASEEAAASSAGADTQAADKEANAALTAAPAAAAADGAAVTGAGVNAAVTAPVAANAAAVAATGAAGGGELSLNFRQDSWVDVKRADNTVLISRLVKAGSTETVDMSQPVSIIIGNIAGVDATLRGAPLDLKAGSKTNVARLNLK
ncbi:helix-turn-helix domain-containing protein [Collimonas sp.]|jgi:cytoskeleton protein RodZ|uniref:helix-turn-helix domain-containing protein n=1 Tax=Collimonas sp. TaxID=1963772 RepID=UPI002D1CB5DE|nr:helix-turn-helix domain-containing protein [Collimonas sp.]HWW99825.1 helix-turn-helix domain-containing protein [Collimonas sp.]